MTYSTRLPKQYRTWSEFYEVVESVLGSLTGRDEFCWKEYEPIQISTDRQIAPIKETVPVLLFSMRYIEQQVLREVREQVKLQTFDHSELAHLYESVRYYSGVFEDEPVLKALKKKVFTLLKQN